MPLRFAEISILDVHQTPFIVALIYANGESVSHLSKPFKDLPDLLEALAVYEIDRVETDSQAFYKYVIEHGIGDIIYHREIESTWNYIRHYGAKLAEIYEIQEESKPPLPKWREWLYKYALKITNKIGGI